MCLKAPGQQRQALRLAPNGEIKEISAAPWHRTLLTTAGPAFRSGSKPVDNRRITLPRINPRPREIQETVVVPLARTSTVAPDTTTWRGVLQSNFRDTINRCTLQSRRRGRQHTCATKHQSHAAGGLSRTAGVGQCIGGGSRWIQLPCAI